MLNDLLGMFPIGNVPDGDQKRWFPIPLGRDRQHLPDALTPRWGHDRYLGRFVGRGRVVERLAGTHHRGIGKYERATRVHKLDDAADIDDDDALDRKSTRL